MGPVLEKNLEGLNAFFARRILKDAYTEERAQFLAELMRVSRDGHLCWQTEGAPEFPSSIVEEGGDRFPKAPVVRHGNRYYLQRNWVIETALLEQLRRLRGSRIPPLLDVEWDGMDLLPEQKEAISNAFQNQFSIICGGPGTGKTYTAAALIRLFLSAKGGKVIVAAPTGKAASHLKSVLGADVEAVTLHRLLGLRPGENRLFSNRIIDANLILVDEASMIDVLLLAQLLESVGDETRLVLVGDPDQLPPIEAGSLFREMASLFGIRLQKSMRTEQTHLAEAVHRGEWLGNLLDFSSLEEKLFEGLEEMLVWDEPNPEDCLKRRGSFRILSALRQGPFGTDALNQKIFQEMQNRIRFGQWWILPILITSNHPDKDLYNGNCGILIGKSRGRIDFRESLAYFPQKIPYRNLPSFELAFCLSVHKSQGSEFERVLALFPKGSEHFGREAIYTAITRAKKGIEVVAEEVVLKEMLAKRSSRTSGFTERF